MIRRLSTLTAAGLFATLLSAAPKPVNVSLKDADGKQVGTAKISAKGKGVKIDVSLSGLTPGDHAIHIHQNAKCEGPKFTTAGGHFNPEGKHHGLLNPDGPHAGDMQNFTVKPDGTAKLSIENDKVTLADADNSLFTGGGTALVVHAMADDLKSDPAGNAGDRIACGLIVK